MTSSYRAIEVLLAEQTPLAPPAERSRLRNSLGLTPTRLARAIGVDTTTLQAWEEGLTEPEAPLRAAYAYFLARSHTLGTYYAQAIAEPHPTAPAEATDTAQESLPLLSQCHPPAARVNPNAGKSLQPSPS